MKILLIFASLLVISSDCMSIPLPYVDEGTCWMKNVPGDKTINKMSIPGTHDTMTYTVGIIPPFAKAQSLDLNQQLEAGVRFFDIRLKIQRFRGQVANPAPVSTHYLGAYHGMVLLPIGFTEIMNIFDTFLNSHPSEAIIFRYKNEALGDGQTSSSHSTFCEVFDDVLLQHRHKIWNYGSEVHNLGSTYPTLEEIRRKMVILQVNSDCFGFKFNTLTLDNYKGGSGTNPFTNQPYVTQMLEEENLLVEIVDDLTGNRKPSTDYKNELTTGLKSTHGKSELTIIFASAVAPPVLTPEGFARDVNPHLQSFLTDNEYLDDLGVVVFDFITDFTPHLPRLIFKRNYEGEFGPVVYQHQPEFPIRRNNLLSTLPVLGREYKMTFQLFINSLQLTLSDCSYPECNPGYAQVIRLTTTDSNCCSDADRINVWWVYAQRFVGGSSINGNYKIAEFKNGNTEMEVGRWYDIETSQRLTGGGNAVFEVKIDGSVVSSTVNNKPQTYEKVSVFAGDNFDTPLDGKLRNLIISTFY